MPALYAASMHRSAHSARRAVSTSSAAAPHGIWITDRVLADALHRYACLSPAGTTTTSQRHGSTTPGPLEHRRRSNHRRMNLAAVQTTDSLPPLPALPKWAQPSDTLDRLRQFIDPNNRIWRPDRFHYQPPDPPSPRPDLVSAYASAPLPSSTSQPPIVSEVTLSPSSSDLQAPTNSEAVGSSVLDHKPKSEHQALSSPDPQTSHPDLGIGRSGHEAKSSNALEQILGQSSLKSVNEIQILDQSTLNTDPRENTLLANRHLANTCIDSASLGTLLQHIADAHTSSKITGWQFVAVIHHLGQLDRDQITRLGTKLDATRATWKSLVSSKTEEARIGLDEFLMMESSTRLHAVKLATNTYTPPKAVLDAIGFFLPLESLDMMTAFSSLNLSQFTRSLLMFRSEEVTRLIENVPNALLEAWALCSMQALCTDVNSRLPEARQRSLRMLSTWLEAIQCKLSSSCDKMPWTRIYPLVAKVCKPADMASHFAQLDSTSTARIIWRYWLGARSALDASLVEAVDAKLTITPDTPIRSLQHRHLAPYINLARYSQQYLQDPRRAQTLVYDLLREQGSWKDFGVMCSLLRRDHGMMIPLQPALKFLQQVPPSEAKAAAKVFLDDNRVHYTDVAGLLDKMRQSKEIHPALLYNFLNRPGAKCHPPTGSKRARRTGQGHGGNFLDATEAVCRTERFSVRTRVSLMAALMRQARRRGVKAPQRLTARLAHMAFAKSMHRGDKIPIDVVRAVLPEIAETHGQEAADAVDRLIYRYWNHLIKGWRQERNAAARAEHNQANLDAGILRPETSS